MANLLAVVMAAVKLATAHLAARALRLAAELALYLLSAEA